MHEVHLMTQVVKMIETSLEGTPEVSPLRVRLGVSALSHLLQHDGDTLQAAFVVAAHGTRAEGAQLEIHPVPVMGRCRACARSMSVSEIVAACPACGSTTVEVQDGPEMVLYEIVVTE